MRQKVFSILALLLMAATGAVADTTVTWTASDMSRIYIDFWDGEAYNNTIKGITVTSSGEGRAGDSWESTDINLTSGSTTITFNSSVGNIKSIAITADINMMDPPSGWTTDYYSTLSWSGDASTTVSLPLSGGTYISEISEIVFTIESSTVNVTGITLDKTEASMIVGGETLTLTPTVAPGNATDKTVTWTTSDAGVATVTNGVVSAVAAGTATITATATNGTAATSDDKTATCTVTVSNPTVTANEGATGEYWATYYNGTTSFTADENTTVFQAALSGSSLTLTEVPNREIPATKAVILKSSSATITLTPASTTETLEGNELQGTTAEMTGAAGNIYVLNKKSDVVGFYKLSSTGTIGANKAYLTYSGPSLARGYFGFDETTGIEMPTAEVIDADAVVYDLQGRRVAQPTKGLYIVNGKKVFINK